MMKDNKGNKAIDPTGKEDENLDQKIIELLNSIDPAPKRGMEVNTVLSSTDLKKKQIPFWEYLVVFMVLVLIIGIGIMINVQGMAH